MKILDGSDVLARVCEAIDTNSPQEAATILSRDYPFTPLLNVGRHYSELQCMEVFTRDGFIDRYSGKRLIFPGTLRLLSKIFPSEFPFHNNWKTDACHFAFWELYPTVDHLVPVSRGGSDDQSNWVSTSMVRNAAKANFTIEELGWQVLPPGELKRWDGLSNWFLRQVKVRQEIQESGYLRRWANAAKRVLAEKI
jgi:5-methylcytosine-specific restriction endonuclease McrA